MKQERRHRREQRGSAGARRNEPWEIRMRAGIAPRCWARSACRRCRPTHAPRRRARSARRCCRPTHAPRCRARSSCRRCRPTHALVGAATTNQRALQTDRQTEKRTAFAEDHQSGRLADRQTATRPEAYSAGRSTDASPVQHGAASARSHGACSPHGWMWRTSTRPPDAPCLQGTCRCSAPLPDRPAVANRWLSLSTQCSVLLPAFRSWQIFGAAISLFSLPDAASLSSNN